MDTLPERLTHQEAPEVTRVLAAALAAVAPSPPPSSQNIWTIDAAALKQFDSSALAVLLECRRLADAKGRQVQISHAPAKLCRLARLYGLDDLLVLEEARTSAAQA